MGLIVLFFLTCLDIKLRAHCSLRFGRPMLISQIPSLRPRRRRQHSRMGFVFVSLDLRYHPSARAQQPFRIGCMFLSQGPRYHPSARAGAVNAPGWAVCPYRRTSDIIPLPARALATRPRRHWQPSQLRIGGSAPVPSERGLCLR